MASWSFYALAWGKIKRPQGPLFLFTGGEGGIDSDRLWAILTPAGRTSCVQNAGAFCRTHGFELHVSSGNKKSPLKGASFVTGGEGGIRTHGTRKRTPDFESGPFDHSGTSPYGLAFYNRRLRRQHT